MRFKILGAAFSFALLYNIFAYGPPEFQGFVCIAFIIGTFL